jgi:hypothetical protein
MSLTLETIPTAPQNFFLSFIHCANEAKTLHIYFTRQLSSAW